MSRRTGARALGTLALLWVAIAATSPARGACRAALPESAPADVRWVRASAAADAPALADWCAAVGTPLWIAPETLPAQAPFFDGLAVVVWNIHVGEAELAHLVSELRTGVLTDGRPVEHFALLLQEVVRVGSAIPAVVGPAAAAAPIGAPADPSRSIEAVAARAGLFGFYAPSMRNGAEHREDRGNAILSTLPLSDPMAIELPYERQRRVAVSAQVSIPTGDGRSVPLRLVSVHFDNATRGARFWRSFGAGRARQAGALVEALDGEETVVVGGDFNTWFGESREEAIVLLRPHFPGPLQVPAVATYTPPYGLPDRQVDYLMARLPAEWEAHYRVDRDKRKSDHAPLIGWIDLPPRDVSIAAEPDEVGLQ